MQHTVATWKVCSEWLQQGCCWPKSWFFCEIYWQVTSDRFLTKQLHFRIHRTWNIEETVPTVAAAFDDSSVTSCSACMVVWYTRIPPFIDWFGNSGSGQIPLTDQLDDQRTSPYNSASTRAVQRCRPSGQPAVVSGWTEFSKQFLVNRRSTVDAWRQAQPEVLIDGCHVTP